MKLSANFASHLEEAYEYYSSPDLDVDNVWEPGIGLRFSDAMFLLEEKDFDKALTVYRHKRFQDTRMEKVLMISKEPYLNTDWSSLEERRSFYEGRYLSSFASTDKFVSEIKSDCSYNKKESGRSLLDQLLQELWYSQEDYQLTKDVSKKYYSLCKFWYLKNRVSRQEEAMNDLYSELLSL